MVVLMDFGGLFTLAEWWNFSSFFVGGVLGGGYLEDHPRTKRK